jgi:MSHA biogenesis protein MshK
MAGAVTVRRPPRPLRRPAAAMLRAPLAVLPALALLASGPAAAETLRDPTRPAFEIGDGGAAGSGGGLVAHPAGGAGGAAGAAGPQLQSVLLRAQGGALAVIDGRTLRIGDRFAGWRVAAIDETTVTLAGGAGRRVLRLTPAADKKTVTGKNRSPAAAAPSAVAAQQGRDRK